MLDQLKLINHEFSLKRIDNANMLQSLWDIEFHPWLSNSTALMLGLCFGFIGSLLKTSFIKKVEGLAKISISYFFEKVFITILPIMMLGFILKMEHEGMLAQITHSCLSLMMLIAVTCLLYLVLLFLLVAKFNVKQTLKYIKNTLPVSLAGFTTMSSLATMPLTLKAAEKNIGDSKVAQLVIPTTVNIHLIGLAINIPLMALTLLDNFGLEFPSFSLYLKFAMSFVFHN